MSDGSGEEGGEMAVEMARKRQALSSGIMRRTNVDWWAGRGSSGGSKEVEGLRRVREGLGGVVLLGGFGGGLVCVGVAVGATGCEAVGAEGGMTWTDSLLR